MTPLLQLYTSAYATWFDRLHGAASFLWVKGGLAFLSIAIPTIAMGGTLPVLARLFETDRSRFGQLAGGLYVLNTAGAALGALVFPYLLAALGISGSNLLCAGVNFAIGFAALILAKGKSGSDLPRATAARVPVAAEASAPKAILVLALISGFVTFALQVGWNRAFAQVHENSVYSFSQIVALFIGAIALGGQLARILLSRGWTWKTIVGRCWMLAGLLVIVSPHIFIRITNG